MIAEPTLQERAAQPYVALCRKLPPRDIGRDLPPLHDEVMGWLHNNGIAPSGAPFFRYLRVDMDADLFEVEVGWPVAAPVQGEGELIGGMLPAGRYGVILNTGPFHELMPAHMALMAWGKANGITWQTSDNGKVWGANIEFYITDPAEEPDPQKWETEIAFLATSV